MEAFPEPRALAKSDLEPLLREVGTLLEVARRSGLSWSGVQEKLRPTRRWDAKIGKFVKIKAKRR